jgi:capsular polysaccharide transport system permease protein
MTVPSKVLTLRDRNGETIPVNASPQAEAGTGPLVVTGAPEKPMVRPSARRRRRGPWMMLSALLLIVGPTLLAAYYYTQIATDQYIAEFKLSVRGGVDRGGGGDAGGAGAAGMVGGMIADAFVVTELINSRQMVADVSNDVDLRQLFSNPKADWWSRLRLPASKEDVVDYWKKVVSAQFGLLTRRIR